MIDAVQKQHKGYTMNSYKINFDQLRQHPEISEMLSALQQGLTFFNIDFYLVGTVARDFWM